MTVRGGLAVALVVALQAAPMSAFAQSESIWDDYHRAFVLLAEGKTGQARDLLQRAAQDPNPQVASLAQQRLSELDATLRAAPETEEGVHSAERPRKLARAELGLWSTINGISAAVNVCLMAECDSDRAFVGAVMAGGVAGLGTALFLTRDGITQGRTQLVNSSIFWGNVNGYLINSIAYGDPFGADDNEEQTAAAISLGSEVAGLGASFALWQAWHPTSGDVALANTFGLWTPIMVLLGHGVIDTEPEIATVLVAIDGGLLAGGLVSTKSRVSRGRTLLIDVGGLVGLLAGGLAVAVIEPDSTTAAFTPVILTTGAGLGLSAYWTRDWDAPSGDGGLAPQVAITPMGEHGWGASLSLDLDL